MSRTIYETRDFTATRMTGPERPGGGDRTMVQITDNKNGQYMQVYPAVLRGILNELSDDDLPKTAAAGDKYQVVASCELFGGTVEARYIVGVTSPLHWFLIVTRPDGQDEHEISAEWASTLVAMQRFSNGDGCDR